MILHHNLTIAGKVPTSRHNLEGPTERDIHQLDSKVFKHATTSKLYGINIERESDVSANINRRRLLFESIKGSMSGQASTTNTGKQCQQMMRTSFHVGGECVTGRLYMFILKT